MFRDIGIELDVDRETDIGINNGDAWVYVPTPF